MTIRLQVLQCFVILALGAYSIAITHRVATIEERVELEENKDELWKRARAHFFELPVAERTQDNRLFAVPAMPPIPTSTVTQGG